MQRLAWSFSRRQRTRLAGALSGLWLLLTSLVPLVHTHHAGARAVAVGEPDCAHCVTVGPAGAAAEVTVATDQSPASGPCLACRLLSSPVTCAGGMVAVSVRVGAGPAEPAAETPRQAPRASVARGPPLVPSHCSPV